jgi:plastocyanin
VVVALVSMAVASVATPAGAATAEVTIANMAFSPQTVTVELTAGEEELPDLHAHVNFVMRDEGVQHTVSFDDRSVALGSSGRLSAGQTYSVIFEEPGTFLYRCEIHPDMTGTVVVTSPAKASRDEAEGDDEGSGTGIGLLLAAAALAAGAAAGAIVLLRRRRRPAGPETGRRPTRSGGP